MNKGSSGIYDRCLEKTPEQLFIGTLRREFELSPAAHLCIHTTHNIESVGRYIKTYKDVLFMLKKEFNVMEIVRVTGRGRSTILQYRKLAYLYHPELDKSGVSEESEVSKKTVD